MEQEKQQRIQREAKQILDKFASALEKVEKGIKEDFYVDRDEFERIEGKGEGCEKGFKERFLGNAPEHDEDFIIVERGNWK